MAFSDREISLSKYKCAKCGRNPQKAEEVFQGCSCGHRLFRIIINQQRDIQLERTEPSPPVGDMEFLSVRERGIGIYDINVDKLLTNGTEESDSPVVAGTNGIYSINVQPKMRKKNKISFFFDST